MHGAADAPEAARAGGVELIQARLDEIVGSSARPAAARKVIEGLGGTMECLYWMTGPDDGLAIFDVPDVSSAGAASVGVTSSGVITSTGIGVGGGSSARVLDERRRED